MPTDSLSKAVLITGCSSGIGRATAERLAGRGWTVYATARRPESIADLEAPAASCSRSTSPTRSRWRAAVGRWRRPRAPSACWSTTPATASRGAVEEVPIDAVRRQFETNVFGLVRMCQLVLPGMRAPGLGQDRQRLARWAASSSSRAAASTTARSTRWRRSATRCASRCAGFGVDVVIIEPGLIKTEFGERRRPARRRRRRRRPLRRLQRRGREDDQGRLRGRAAPSSAAARDGGAQRSRRRSPKRRPSRATR